MKVQQMAFVLAAIVIFFALAGLMFLSIRLKSLESGVGDLKEEEAKVLVRKLAGSPELLDKECAYCVDFDKIMALKGREGYEGFWNLDYLAVRIDYPVKEDVKCSAENYPNCNIIEVVEGGDFGAADSAFVSVCRWEGDFGGYKKCEIGKILASGEGING